MIRQSVFIPHKFPGLNDYIAAERKHRILASKMKKEWTDIAAIYALKLSRIAQPVEITLEWVEPDTRRDPDNIIFAKKFIFDGLVKMGILPDDNQKWIIGISESWRVDKTRIGVKVQLS